MRGSPFLFCLAEISGLDHPTALEAMSPWALRLLLVPAGTFHLKRKIPDPAATVLDCNSDR